MLKEKAHLLLKSLPQKLRRHCVPLPEYAQGFVERWARARISKTAFTMRTHRWADRCADTGRAEHAASLPRRSTSSWNRCPRI